MPAEPDVTSEHLPRPRGHRRGTPINTPNRFTPLRGEIDDGALADLDPDDVIRGDPQTHFFDDASQSVLSRNDSPDVP